MATSHFHSIGFEGDSTVIGSETVSILMKDSSDKVLLASGTTKPTDGTAGYAKGCIFLDTDASAGSIVFFNEGSTTSCNFDAPGAAAATTYAGLSDVAAIVQYQYQKGNATGTALEAGWKTGTDTPTSGNVMVADGTKFNSATPDSAGLVAKSGTQTGIAGAKTFSDIITFSSNPVVPSGSIKATYLQAAAADLGDADVTINLSNTNTGNVTNLTIDGDFTGNRLYGDVTGNVTGNCSGTAATLATARKIGNVDFNGSAAITPEQIAVVAESSDTSCSVLFVTAVSGDLQPKTNTGLTFNSNTSILTATGFAGALTGNVTGDCSGSSGTCTGNAGTVTNGIYTTDTGTVTAKMLQAAAADLGAADININLGNTNGAFVTNLTTDGTITALAFSGDLTGDVTGDCSGSSGSCTGNAATVTNGVYTTDTGTVTAKMLQSAAADLGAADVNINLGNTNGAFVTNLTTDGTITALAFSGDLTGDVTGTVSGNSGTVTNGVYTTDTGTVTAKMLQNAAADLGAADVNINLSNSSAGKVTNLTIDGTMTANEFSGNLTGDITGNADTVTNGVYTTGSTMGTDAKLYFRDTGLYVYSSGDGVLDIISDTTLNIQALDDASTTNIGTGNGVNTISIGNHATPANVIAIGGAASTLGIGAVTTIATDKKLQFRDTGIYANSSTDGRLDIAADTHMALTAPVLGLGGNIGVFSGVFDPSTNAGERTVAAHDLLNGGVAVTIPDNARVISAWYEVETTMHSPTTGAGEDKATLAIGVASDDAEGIVAPVAIESGSPWDDSSGAIACIPDFATVGDWTTQTTAARAIQVTVGVDPLDAGKMKVWGFYAIGV